MYQYASITFCPLSKLLIRIDFIPTQKVFNFLKGNKKLKFYTEIYYISESVETNRINNRLRKS